MNQYTCRTQKAKVGFLHRRGAKERLATRDPQTRDLQSIDLWLMVGMLMFLLSVLPASAGKYGADFLDIGVGARTLALGASSVALVDDATAGYWNPAGLARVEHFSGYAMAMPRFGGLQQYQNLALAWPTRIGRVGITWLRLGIDEIPIYAALEGTHEQRLADRSLQPSAEPEGFLADTENAYYLSYAGTIQEPWRVGRRRVYFSVGGNLKYITQRLGSCRGSGIGLDFGAQARLQGEGEGRPITFGITIHDAYTTTLDWNTASRRADVIRGNIRVGVAYRPKRGFWSQTTLLADFHSRNGPVFHFGIESEHLKWVLLRAGLNGTHPSFGAGLRVAGINVDYAFTTHDLDSVHQVSLSVVR